MHGKTPHRQAMGDVSVILPVHNREVMVGEAVESALSQSLAPKEIIVVDDGSTDGTSETLAELERKHPDHIRLLRIENSGPGVARQAGLDIATASYVQFLDSDDLLEPEKLALQVSGLDRRPECVAAYGPTAYRQPDQPEDYPMRRTGESIQSLFPAMLSERWWATVSPLYRRSALEKIGPWLPLRLNEDWEYDCRLAALNGSLHWVPGRLATMRGHGGSRLSRRERFDRSALEDQATAAMSILKSAQTAGVPREDPDYQHFAHRLFMQSRNCASAGLSELASQLHALAGTILIDPKTRRRHRQFGTLATVFGWRIAGGCALVIEKALQAASNGRP